MADDLPPGFSVVSTPPALRPFRPGETRPNADGSVSTEISTTWQLPDGQWVNVPSLWMGQNGPQQFDEGDEQGILGAMRAYEAANGPTFSRFPSVQEAEAAARDRSAHGGAAAGSPQNDLPPGFSVVPQEQPSVAYDMAAAVPSGLARGAVETAMAIPTAGRLAEGGLDWLRDTGENLTRKLVGAEPISDEQRAEREAFRGERWSDKLGDLIFGAQDAVRGVMDENLYEPQTMPGQFVETISEFAVPGSLPSRVERTVAAAPSIAQRVGNAAEKFVGNAVVPGVASEAAGQATEGTWMEPWARALGALGGNVATAAGRSYNAPEAIARRSAPEMTPDQWEEVRRLVENRFGIDISTPEAISQVAGGRTGLQDVMRFIESTIEGRNATAPFFTNRTGQIDNSVHDFLDLIAPQDANPSTLGARASGVAGEVIDNTRQDINASTRPLYNAAEAQPLPAGEFAQVRANPSFAAALERLRNDPELGPRYANLPDNSVGVVDAVSKDMFARGEAMRNTANPLYGPERGALTTGAATDARSAASRSSPEYAQALAEQEARRAAELAPLENGPVGRVASANSTQTAGEALLPRNPLGGAGPETADAVTRLSAQDPATTSALVRQNLGDRYQRAGTETQTGSREWVGGKFHKDVAGNEARQEVLDAALSALPQAGPSRDAAELLEILQASGRRDAVGSPTFGNASISSDIELTPNVAAGTANAVSTGGLGVLKRLGDAATQYGARRAYSQLADMFTGPDRLYLTQRAIERGAPVNLSEAFRYALPQAGPAIYDQ